MNIIRKTATENIVIFCHKVRESLFVFKKVTAIFLTAKIQLTNFNKSCHDALHTSHIATLFCGTKIHFFYVFIITLLKKLIAKLLYNTHIWLNKL